MSEPTKPSYEELEAQAAAMRAALEDVWSVCSREHWQQVGKALEGDAGKHLLEELAKIRYERDLLRHPVEDLVTVLDRHDRAVLLDRSFTDPIPDHDEHHIEHELQLGDLRAARKALQAVEATPDKIGRMKTALQEIEGYSHFRADVEDRTDAKEAELDALAREIPRKAYRALNSSSLPATPDLMEDATLAEARRYEEALRQIAVRAAHYSEEQPDLEISHALMVEMPHDAHEALNPPDYSQDGGFDPDFAYDSEPGHLPPLPF